MKKRLLLYRFLFVFALYLLNLNVAEAWGLNGHRIVGEIASRHLTRKAKKSIQKILGDESIAMCSNWPDFIKSDHRYDKYYNWHFVNLEAGMDCDSIHRFLDADTTSDAYTKLNFLIDQLKQGTLTDSLKREYLKLLIHIVGDIHQPLHVGHFSDRGGNRIKLLWFRDSSNLHQVWDERLLDFQMLSYTEYADAINYIHREESDRWSKMSLKDWICDSYLVAQNIYQHVESSNHKLGYAYNYRYLSTLNSQLLKGGYHLAQILNDIFG